MAAPGIVATRIRELELRCATPTSHYMYFRPQAHRQEQPDVDFIFPLHVHRFVRRTSDGAPYRPRTSQTHSTPESASSTPTKPARPETPLHYSLPEDEPYIHAPQPARSLPMLREPPEISPEPELKQEQPPGAWQTPAHSTPSNMLMDSQKPPPEPDPKQEQLPSAYQTPASSTEPQKPAPDPGPMPEQLSGTWQTPSDPTPSKVLPEPQKPSPEPERKQEELPGAWHTPALSSLSSTPTGCLESAPAKHLLDSGTTVIIIQPASQRPVKVKSCDMGELLEDLHSIAARMELDIKAMQEISGKGSAR